MTSFYWWIMKRHIKDLNSICIDTLILLGSKNGIVIDFEEFVLNSLQTVKPHLIERKLERGLARRIMESNWVMNTPSKIGENAKIPPKL